MTTIMNNVITFILFSIVVKTIFADVKCPVNSGIVYMKHPNSCSKYYLCLNGKSIEQDCADDLYFNIETGYCGPQEDTKCNLNVCTNNDVIELVANPEDCERYFLCNNGLQIPLECGNGRLFDPLKRYCDDAEKVNCEAAQLTVPAVPNICPARGLSQLPHPTDCKRFIVCVDGLPSQYKCSDGLNFDASISRCNYPSLSKCFKK